jgi:hypothetical protein
MANPSWWSAHKPVWWDALNPRCQQLMDGVAAVVQRGGVIHYYKGKRTDTWAQWFSDSSVEIGLNTVGLGIAAVGAGVISAPLSLPVATAVGTVAGVKLATKLLGDGWSAFWTNRSTSRINSLGGLGPTKTDAGGFQEINEDFGEKALSDIAVLLKRGGLEEIYAAFTNLNHDYEMLKNAWFDIDSSRQTPRFSLPATKIRNCDDAVKLWEALSRVRMRFEEVGKAGEDLENFVTYVTLAVSRYTANSYPQMRGLWNTIITGELATSRKTGMRKGAAARLLDHLGKVASSKNIQNTWLGMMGRGDQGLWAFDQLSYFKKEYGSPMKKSFWTELTIEANRRRNPAAFEKLARAAHGILQNEAEAGVLDMGSEWVKGPFNINDAGFYVGVVVNLGEGYLSDEGIGSGVLWKQVEQFHTLFNSSWETWISFDLENWTEGVPAMGELALGALVKGVVKSRAGGRASDESLSAAERVMALKTLNEHDVDDYVGLIEEWKTAYELVQNAGGDPVRAAEALLRFAKVEQAYYGSKTGRILEIVGTAIADFRRQMVAFDRLARNRTNHYLSHHPVRPCSDTTCCYGSVLTALQHMGRYSDQNVAQKFPVPTQKGWAKTPCQPLDQPSALDAAIAEARRQRFMR